ncbi:hypothetical protein SAMN04487949_1433 [Halogranum gelatinilyticum]|uniref:Uncharacterized protein n=2 Tax=Halogranum gelatinilyticum TaxID=660521 RepID=A0A1G9SNF5_9EURY|nr:hypothetical protein SAMN04487949_1433 [Halogranum gelatinilyticum]
MSSLSAVCRRSPAVALEALLAATVVATFGVGLWLFADPATPVGSTIDLFLLSPALGGLLTVVVCCRGLWSVGTWLRADAADERDSYGLVSLVLRGVQTLVALALVGFAVAGVWFVSGLTVDPTVGTGGFVMTSFLVLTAGSLALAVVTLAVAGIRLTGHAASV